MSGGGMLNADECIRLIVEKANNFQKLEGYFTTDNNLVLIFETEPTITTTTYINKLITSDDCKHVFDDAIDFDPMKSSRAISIPILLEHEEIELMKKGGELWIQEAVKEMKEKGTEGAFTNQAKREGMDTISFAKKVINNPDKYTDKTYRRAMFVKNTNPEKFK